MKVVAAPDSGFFVDLFLKANSKSNTKNSVFIDIITDKKRSILQPEGCVYLHDDDNVFKCTIMQYVVDLMPVPVFIINSLHDRYNLRRILEVQCISDEGSFENCSNEDV